ncbi:MAG: sulfite exporter TauE/SafE family protein [Sedimentisphaerales bacterium]|nr:sulfite exporter TauE/SafE family protein [Sedimentisphaerales bacterium]
MTKELGALAVTAATIGFFHTLFGPDHYLPFIMISWARKWSNLKTAFITFLCGLGHIGSSIVLGFIGILLGWAVKGLVDIESFRGNIAAWLLIAFGLVYMVWGLRQAIRNKPHEHSHAHVDKFVHKHIHSHQEGHVHIHNEDKTVNVTPWVLFIIFIFGPCEPLIPILMYPAAEHSVSSLIFITAVFGIVTISTMLGMVMLARAGINLIPLKHAQRYSHLIAGASILLCGLAIAFLGL